MTLKNRGFTLLETLFSMVVILVGVVAVLVLFQNGISNMTLSAERMEMAILSSNFFEEMKSFGYANLPGSGTVAALATANAGRINNFPPPYAGTVTMTAISEDLDGVAGNDYADKTGTSTLKEITLVVSAPGTRVKDVTFRTRIAR